MNHDVVERVRRAIYDTFAGQGYAPSRQQIRDLAAVAEAQVNEAVAELAAQRHLALDQSGNVVMAHPFTTVNLGFSVMGETTLWWGGCAWDSFAIPNLVKDEPSVLVATTCPACRRPLAWTVRRSGPPEGPEVAHFLVPMDKAWNDVVYTCSSQRSSAPSTACRPGSPAPARHRATLSISATLWRLASDWYSGRLDSPTAEDPRVRRLLLPWPPRALLGAQRLTSRHHQSQHHLASATSASADHLPQREPFPPEFCADLPAADAKPAGQRDGIAQSP